MQQRWGIWIVGCDFPKGRFFQEGMRVGGGTILLSPDKNGKVPTFSSRGRAKAYAEAVQVLVQPNTCEVKPYIGTAR